LWRAPGFTLSVIATLALGIGSATAIFSVADLVLFRAPPYPRPDELVVLGFTQNRGAYSGTFIEALPAVQLATYREYSRSFVEFASLEFFRVNLVSEGTPMGVALGRVSHDYFHTLGVLPALGRVFLPEENRAGANGVVVLSHRLWQQMFSGDPGVLGRDVLVGGQSCRVIGVLGRDFRTPLSQPAADLFQPVVIQIDPARMREMLSSHYAIARLRPGVTPTQATQELAGIKVPLPASLETFLADRTVRAASLAESRPTRLQEPYWALLAAVGFLYAIACINAVNLMLARVLGRRKELSVRLAVGCSRGQLARLLLTESLVLTVLAGLAGLLVAIWGFPAMLALAPAGAINSLGTTGLDWRALAFTLALSVPTGFLVALAPAWRVASTNAIDGLKEGGQALGESRRLRQVRSALVVLEAALAVVLLAGAGLMVRSVARLQEIDRGFDPADKVAVWLQLPVGSYGTVETRQQFFRRLDEQVRAIPGVLGVAMTSAVPLAGISTQTLTKPDGTEIRCGMYPVSAGFLRTLGLPMKKGRWFEERAAGGAPVVVISESMVRDYFDGKDPLGRHLPLGSRKEGWEVIGIVADVREQPREKPRPQIYYPSWQSPRQEVVSILMRLANPTDAKLGEAVRRAVFAVDPLVAAMPPRVLLAAAESQIRQERFTLTVLQVLATLSLALAALGLFAVMAYSVRRRQGEFGVRLALGATPRDLFRLVLTRGLALVALGVVIGLGLAWGLTRFLQNLLYETSPNDPLVYAAVAALLLLVAALGCWLPARQATRVNPADVLRAE